MSYQDEPTLTFSGKCFSVIRTRDIIDTHYLAFTVEKVLKGVYNQDTIVVHGGMYERIDEVLNQITLGEYIQDEGPYFSQRCHATSNNLTVTVIDHFTMGAKRNLYTIVEVKE
jgi:hypothetical protein